MVAAGPRGGQVLLRVSRRRNDLCVPEMVGRARLTRKDRGEFQVIRHASRGGGQDPPVGISLQTQQEFLAGAAACVLVLSAQAVSPGKPGMAKAELGGKAAGGIGGGGVNREQKKRVTSRWPTERIESEKEEGEERRGEEKRERETWLWGRGSKVRVVHRRCLDNLGGRAAAVHAHTYYAGTQLRRVLQAASSQKMGLWQSLDL